MDLRGQTAKLSRSEAYRKDRDARRRNIARCVKDPYVYARGLFEASKSGELKASKEEIEEHLQCTYGGSVATESHGEFPRTKRPTEPGCEFYTWKITTFEVDDVMSRARAKSSPGINRISYEVYAMCPRMRGLSAELLDELWARGTIPDEWCSTDGVYIPMESAFKIYKSVPTYFFVTRGRLNVLQYSFKAVYAICN